MAKPKVQGGAKKENIDDLKQELDIDYHKITSDELYQRFQTHPENVKQKKNQHIFQQNMFNSNELFC